MYFKYSGFDRETNSVRVSFLKDGLFRFTQPKYLNDPKEGKPKFYFHKYSPKDIALARKELLKDSAFSFGNQLSDDEVINLALNPFPSLRFGDAFPHLVQQKGFSSMEEYDKSQLQKIFNNFHDKLNIEIGVFSLAKNKNNNVMWSSYCNGYNGLVVEFGQGIEGLPRFISKEVSYDPETIDFEISLNEGIVRFNGEKIDLISKDTPKITDSLIESFLFHKTRAWSYEEEFRLVSRLCDTNIAKGEIYLRNIPFELFRAIYIGCKVNSKDKENLLSIILNNRELQHINIYHQGFNELTGDIEFIQASL